MTENLISPGRYRPEGIDALVRLRHAYKVYRVGDVGVVALGGVDLDVMPAEFLAVVGPSGAGKSTILNLVGGLDRASAGIVEVEGRDLGLLGEDVLTEYRAERVGFVWQGTARNLVPYLSVRDNIRLPATVRRTQVARKHDVDGLLELVGLTERAKHKPGMLSGGEQQRVAIARALVRKPRLILADEPTGALDVDTGQAVMALLDTVASESGSALITITHDVNVAALASACYRLEAGVLTGAEIPARRDSNGNRVRIPAGVSATASAGVTS